MPLRPELQALFEAIRAAHPDGLTLDELSDETVRRPLSFADIEALIVALEEAGVSLDGPASPPRPEDLVEVLAAARALAQEQGRTPSVTDIATRAGRSPILVRRALRFGRSLSG